MAHAWDSLIVGGTDVPRFLLCGDNLCNNPFFTVDTTGYSAVGGVLTRTEHIDAYGQYMASLVGGYAEFTYNYGSAIIGKKFILSLDVINNGNVTVSFAATTEFGSTVNSVTANKLTRVINIQTATAQAGNNIKFRVYGADIKFDNIFFAEVLYDIEMPQPNASECEFTKELSGENTLWSGNIQEYNKHWIPNYKCEYQALSRDNELLRQRISEANHIFTLPHKDVKWGFLGKWADDDFMRKYTYERFVAHESLFLIKGSETMKFKPILTA